MEKTFAKERDFFTSLIPLVRTTLLHFGIATIIPLMMMLGRLCAVKSESLQYLFTDVLVGDSEHKESHH